MQLIDPLPGEDENTDEATRVWYAILLRLDGDGHSNVVFGPNEKSWKKGTEVADLVARYSGRRLFLPRMVGREALVEIATALKKYGPEDFSVTRAVGAEKNQRKQRQMACHGR